MRTVARLLVLLPLIWVREVWAVDCAQNFISLNSQASIDGFQETYGPCDTANQIQIHDGADGVTDITNIDSLSGLKIIGSFSAFDSPLLENLDGLASLKKLGNLNLQSGLDSLVSISGVSHLGHLGSLTIYNNTSLTALPSFNALRVSGTISIVSTSLQNLHGLHRLARLENFTSVWGCCHNPFINLQNNPLLTDCSALAPLLGWPETTHSEDKDWVDEVSYINSSNVLISNNGAGASNPNDCLSGYPEYLASDSDSDGVVNEDDAFPLDPAAAVDTDDDGLPDAWLADKTAADSTTVPPLTVDNDDDGDFLDDVTETDAGTDPLNPDTDGDTVFDGLDAFPTDISEWVDTDGDGVGDFADEDDDNDGISDQNDVSPYLATEVPCKQHDIWLVGQSAVDSFQEQYGPCNVITGSLDVWGDTGSGNTAELVRSQDIENLDGLSQISQVGGWMKLNRLDDLTNIAGLISLRSAPRGFTLQSTKQVRNLQGLNNLTTPNLKVNDNSNLRSLSGVSSLPTVFGHLGIQENSVLPTIDGIEKIVEIGTLFIHANGGLTDVSALTGLESTFEGLSLTSNIRLQDCSPLRNVLGWPAFPYSSSTSNVIGYLDISGNGYNASSPNHCLTGYNSGDNDEDGVPNEDDLFPDNPDESADSDSDGIGDNADQCADTSSFFGVYSNGCSSRQLDLDGDGFSDVFDHFPDNPLEQYDSDSDGVGDNSDVCPFNNSVQTGGASSDGVVVCGSDEDLDGLIDDAEIIERFTIYGSGRFRLLGMSDDGGRIAALHWDETNSGSSVLVFSRAANGAWSELEQVAELNARHYSVRIAFDNKIETAILSVADSSTAYSASILGVSDEGWSTQLDLAEEPIGGANCGAAIGISGAGQTVAFACGLDGEIRVLSSTPSGWVERGESILLPPFKIHQGSYLGLSRDGDIVALAGVEDSLGKAITLHWSEGDWSKESLSIAYTPKPQFAGNLLAVGDGSNELAQAGAISVLQREDNSWSPYGEIIKGLEYEELNTNDLAMSDGADVLLNYQNLFLTMGIRVLRDGDWPFLHARGRTWDLMDASNPRWRVSSVITSGSLWFLGSGTPVISKSGRLFALATDAGGNGNRNYIRIFEIVGDIRRGDTDNDGLGNATDLDDDNDGTPDAEDAFPLDETETLDTDSDGIGNNADTDDDNDGVPDSQDDLPLDATESVDTDGDGVGNNADTDDDNDGLSDVTEAELGTDPLKQDTDGDGWSDKEELDEGTDPLQASSQPEVNTGLPIWLLYQATQ